MPVKQNSSNCPFNHPSVADLSSSSVENLSSWRCFFSNLEIEQNHLVQGQEDMVDDAILQIPIEVLQLVQHATGEQVHCCAKNFPRHFFFNGDVPFPK